MSTKKTQDDWDTQLNILLDSLDDELRDEVLLWQYHIETILRDKMENDGLWHLSNIYELVHNYSIYLLFELLEKLVAGEVVDDYELQN